MAHTTSIRAQPGSPLLSLPAEIRNQIYEYVGKDIKFGVISSYGNGIPGCSSVQYPLVRLCRQLWRELSPIAVEASRSCRVIKVHFKEFNMPPANLVPDILASLPPHPPRRYSETVSIDKHFGCKFSLKVLDVLGGLHGLDNDGDLIKLEPVACEVKVTAGHFDVLTRVHGALRRARGHDDGEIAVEIALHAAMQEALFKSSSKCPASDDRWIKVDLNLLSKRLPPRPRTWRLRSFPAQHHARTTTDGNQLARQRFGDRYVY